VPAVTWPTTITPILQSGCIPVFVDIDLTTLNLRPEDLAAAWSPRTRAIFAVHLLGNPVAMEPVMEFARERDLWVLEDTCESLGSTVAGRHAGAFGHIGTFSFYFSHHITTIEGGMLVTDDVRLADLARSMRAHGWTRDMSNRTEIESANPWIDPRFLFAHVGYNLRPMELQAAFGLVQLRRLPEFNQARRGNARRLLAELSDIEELEFVAEQEGGRSTWFGFPMLTRDAATRWALSRHLEENQIETRAIVAGNLAIQPAFRDSRHRTVGSLANATAIGQRGLFIGNHPNLDERRLDHIVSTFRSFFGRS
jgi:CDP-4-dehydro-6-deoxyglucose reductase, E1